MKFHYLLISVTLHLFLAGMMVVHYHQTQLEKTVDTYVPVYSSASIQAREQQALPTKKNPMIAKRSAQSTLATEATKPERDDKLLLKILHEAIANQQQYPESALQLNQTGTVKVGFLLQPDGQVRNVIVLASSGNNHLDQAALSAVQATTPISHVNRYLKQTKSMEVDIVFK